MRQPWTPEEVGILRQHYPELGPKGTAALLTERGYPRSYAQTKAAAMKRSIRYGGRAVRYGNQMGCLPSMRPTYKPEVANQLVHLAESRPDPATYAREKARILGRPI